MQHATKLLLRWWVTFSLVCFGMAMIFVTGLFATINQADVTKLSFLIGGLLIFFSVRTGLTMHGLQTPSPDVITKSRKFYDLARFISNVFLDLGMIGTVIGFIYMLSISFGGIDLVNTASLRSALQSMGVGMSTALYTTAAGLISSVLLRLQLYPLGELLNDTTTHQ